MSDASVRLFVALELPDQVKSALTSWCAAQLGTMEQLRAVSAEALHLTLCFLGWRPGEEVEPIAAACRAAAAEQRAVTVSLREVLWLPRRRPRVLAISLDPVSDIDRSGLQELHAGLSAALTADGFYEPETRPFLAHVTMARVRGRARIRPLELAAPERLPFPLSAVTLFRSHPERGGSRYEPLARVQLRTES